MIDYEEWAKEYEQEADDIAKKMDKLSQKLSKKLPACEKLEINIRLKRLKILHRDKCDTAKFLRERGKAR